jgi:hypothetical protein
MEHRIEIAPSGRATCKSCGSTIAKGELRLGEEYPSQFGSDGVAIRWHHLLCAAGKIPAVLQSAMETFGGEIPNREAIDAAIAAKASKGGKGAAKAGTGAFPSADLAPTNRAKCIQCSEVIAKGTVRIAVEREVDTGSFTTKGAGYLHPLCAEAWSESEWEDGLEDLIEKVKANTGLDALPPPFGEASPEPQEDSGAKPKNGAKKASEAVDSASEGDAKAPASSVKAKKAPAEEAAGAGYETLTAKQVAGVVAKLAKLTDEFKGDSVIEKTGLPWGQRDGLRWHIAAQGLLSPSHPTLMRRLAESTSSAGPEVVFGVVPRLTEKAKDNLILPDWAVNADSIVLRAMELDPARLENLLEGAPPLLRRGIQFVRARCGVAIPEEERGPILKGLAAIEAGGYGIGRTYGQDGQRITLKSTSPGGLVEAHREVESLAGVFGTHEAWLDALAEASKEARFMTLERVLPGLARLPLEDFVRALSKPHLNSGDNLDKDVLQLIHKRADDPAALAQAALKIGRDEYPGSLIREQLLVHAIARMGAANSPIPEGLENEPKWEPFSYCITPWRGSAVMREAYYGALRALSKERVQALVEPILTRPWGQSQALPFLAVHFDAVSFEKLIKAPTEQGLSNPDVIGPMGAQALPFLLAANAVEGLDEKRKNAIAKAIRAVLGFLGSKQESFDASLDVWLSASPQDSYWPEESKSILLLSLRAMPEARRIAVLDRLFEGTKQVERAFYGVQTVEDAAYRKKAARRLTQSYAKVADRSTLQIGLRALGTGSLASFREALIEEKPDAKFFEELAFIFGAQEVDAIRKSANVVEETKLARLQRLAKAYLEANPTSPSERIYLLERQDFEKEVSAPRAGSFSRSRGAGPSGFERGGKAPAVEPGKVFSLDQVVAMKSSLVSLAGKKQAAPANPDEEHILTIDLEEVPELKRRYPDARAIALYAESPDTGDEWEGAKLIPVPASATAPSDGTPITVLPLDVPSRVFNYEATREDLALKEIRGLVFNRPGYVLGEPMYIQDDEGGGVGFVMQLAESIADLNLGDSGSLYVFEGATFMQCY